jgi:hypothetical protein
MLIKAVDTDTALLDPKNAKLFAAARNMAKNPYMVREGDVTDAELSAVLNGLLDLFGAKNA